MNNTNTNTKSRFGTIALVVMVIMGMALVPAGVSADEDYFETHDIDHDEGDLEAVEIVFAAEGEYEGSIAAVDEDGEASTLWELAGEADEGETVEYDLSDDDLEDYEEIVVEVEALEVEDSQLVYDDADDDELNDPEYMIDVDVDDEDADMIDFWAEESTDGGTVDVHIHAEADDGDTMHNLGQLSGDVDGDGDAFQFSESDIEAGVDDDEDYDLTEEEAEDASFGDYETIVVSALDDHDAYMHDLILTESPDDDSDDTDESDGVVGGGDTTDGLSDEVIVGTLVALLVSGIVAVLMRGAGR